MNKLASLFGYVIGGVFVISIIFAPGAIAIYFSYDLYNALQLPKTMAPVSSCDCKSSGRGKSHCGYPVVKLSDGQRIEGQIGEFKWFGGCKRLIGAMVPVYVDESNNDKSRIATLWQLWFMPIVFTLVSLVWYPVAYRGYKKKYRRWKSS